MRTLFLKCIADILPGLVTGYKFKIISQIW